MKGIILTALTLILFLLLIVGATARLGWWPVSATGVPSHWESAFDQAMRLSFPSGQRPNQSNPAFKRGAHRRFKDFQDELRRVPRITRSTEPMGDSKFLSTCSAIRAQSIPIINARDVYRD